MTRIECRGFDVWSCDYLDDTLPLERRREADAHLLGCADCREALAEAELAAGILRREPAVEPPPELLAEILHETIGYRAGSPALAGGGEGGGLFGFLKPFLNPFTQPRFVMSMAMTALSFSMLTFYGQRAFEAWRDAETTPAVETFQAFRADVAEVWGDAVEMAEAAREFVELQTAEPYIEPAATEADQEGER